MAQLRQEYRELVKLDVEVIVIGPEKPEAFRKYWERESMPFIGLPDPDHSVMQLYGQEVKILKLGRMPAQMLINKLGEVKHVYYGKSMADIPDISMVKEVLNA